MINPRRQDANERASLDRLADDRRHRRGHPATGAAGSNHRDGDDRGIGDGSRERPGLRRGDEHRRAHGRRRALCAGRRARGPAGRRLPESRLPNGASDGHRHGGAAGRPGRRPEQVGAGPRRAGRGRVRDAGEAERDGSRHVGPGGGHRQRDGHAEHPDRAAGAPRRRERGGILGRARCGAAGPDPGTRVDLGGHGAALRDRRRPVLDEREPRGRDRFAEPELRRRPAEPAGEPEPQRHRAGRGAEGRRGRGDLRVARIERRDPDHDEAGHPGRGSRRAFPRVRRRTVGIPPSGAHGRGAADRVREALPQQRLHPVPRSSESQQSQLQPAVQPRHERGAGGARGERERADSRGDGELGRDEHGLAQRGPGSGGPAELRRVGTRRGARTSPTSFRARIWTSRG